MRQCTWIASVIALLCGTPPALLAEVILVSQKGQPMVGGGIKAEDERQIILDIYRGFTQTIPKAAIAKRTDCDRTQPEDRAALAEQLEKLAANDLKGRLALIGWAREKGLGIPAAKILHDLQQRFPRDPGLLELRPLQAERLSLSDTDSKFLQAQLAAYFANAGESGKVLKALQGRDVLPLIAVGDWAARCNTEARKGATLQSGDSSFKHTAPDFDGKVHIELWRKDGKLDEKDDAPWPVLLSLHGGGLNQGTWSDGASMFLKEFKKHLERVILVAPNVLQQRYAEWGGNPLEEQYVSALLLAVKRSWKIDTNRIYLAGYSMGGYGTWHIGGHQADRFAGLVSGAGGILIGSSAGRAWGWGTIGNLMHTPIAFLHGGKDVASPPWSDEQAHKILDVLGTEHAGLFKQKYLFYPDSAHMVPGKGIVEAVEWVCQFKREPYQKKLIWEPDRSFNTSFHWLRLAKPEMYQRIEAEIVENKVSLRTLNVNGGLSVFLSPRLVDFSKEVIIEINGEVLFKGRVQPTLSALLESVGERVDDEEWYCARVDF